MGQKHFVILCFSFLLCNCYFKMNLISDRVDKITSRVWSYWFPKTDFKKWFSGSFDAEIKQMFKQDLLYAEGIVRYSPSLWTHKNGRLKPKRLLSLIVVLDQFSRNCYRGASAMYKNDHICISVLLQYLQSQTVKDLCAFKDDHLLFLLMPLQHATSQICQQLGIVLLSNILHYKHDFDLSLMKKYHQDTQNITNLRSLQTKVMQYKGTLPNALCHQIGHYIVLLKFGDFPKRYSPAYVNRKWGQQGSDHLHTDNPY